MKYRQALSYSLLAFIFPYRQVCLAQPALPIYKKQFSINNDNDLYALKGTDRYYSDGLIFQYSYLSKKNKPAILKTINRFEVGQQIFKAQRREIHPWQIYDVDRPVAGYLYLKFLRTKFYKSQTSLNYGISIGTVGPNSLAKNFEDFYHRQININSAHWNWIWDYQIKNEAGINLHGTYAFQLVKKVNTLIQITPVTTSTLGTSFTNFTQAVALQIGRFNKMHESSFWDATMGVYPLSELFFFYKPAIMYQLYNATVQGGMFRQDKGPIISFVEPFVVTHELGLMLSKPRFTISTHMYYQSKEATSQLHNHAYGRLQCAYRFR